MIEERRLLEVVDRVLFEEPEDWRALLPQSLGESFTTGDLAEAMDIRRPLAQKMAYCLRKARLIEMTGPIHMKSPTPTLRRQHETDPWQVQGDE